MPKFVFRSGVPVLDASGNVLYVQPVRAIQHVDGIWYPGIYNPKGYVYNKVPNDYDASLVASVWSDGNSWSDSGYWNDYEVV